MKRNVVVVLLLLVICVCNLFFLIEDHRSSQIPEDKTAADIYAESLFSVVELKASNDDEDESFGTAVFINESGELITNAHVIAVEKGNETTVFPYLQIRFAFEEEYRSVSLLHYNMDLDLAYLSLDNAENCSFKPIEFGDSNHLRSGDTVYAVGNSSGYGIAISGGMVSVPLVNIQYSGRERKVIQCDLTIVAGNSGGALLDENGALIGITSFRAKDNLGNVIYGIAYSVPVDVVIANMA